MSDDQRNSPLDRKQFFAETAEETLEALEPYLIDPLADHERILEILITDYRLIHILAKRNYMK